MNSQINYLQIKKEIVKMEKWIIPQNFSLENEFQILKNLSKKNYDLDFEFDEFNIFVISNLICYFNDIPKEGGENYFPKKGIMLVGE